VGEAGRLTSACGGLEFFAPPGSTRRCRAARQGGSESALESLGVWRGRLTYRPLGALEVNHDSWSGEMETADLWTVDLVHGTASHVPLASCCPFLLFAGVPLTSVPLLGATGLVTLALALAIAGWHLVREQRS